MTEFAAWLQVSVDFLFVGIRFKINIIWFALFQALNNPAIFCRPKSRDHRQNWQCDEYERDILRRSHFHPFLPSIGLFHLKLCNLIAQSDGNMGSIKMLRRIFCEHLWTNFIMRRLNSGSKFPVGSSAITTSGSWNQCSCDSYALLFTTG